jgi:DNA-binding GntR family transcriptional regulator
LSAQRDRHRRRGLAELQELMDALLAGDGQAACMAATRHVQNATAAAIALLRRERGRAAG